VGGALQRRDRADGERGGASCLRHLETTIKHPVGFGEYLTLAWLGASLATVVGALGASLEDEETVREASYGYRQRRRHEDDNDDGEDES
jgi:hypothetical protein